MNEQLKLIDRIFLFVYDYNYCKTLQLDTLLLLLLLLLCCKGTYIHTLTI